MSSFSQERKARAQRVPVRLTAAVLGAIHPGQAGIGSAINNAVSRVAGLVTVALVGTIVGGALSVEGFQRVMAVTAILTFAVGLISFVGIRTAAPRAADFDTESGGPS